MKTLLLLVLGLIVGAHAAATPSSNATATLDDNGCPPGLLPGAGEMCCIKSMMSNAGACCPYGVVAGKCKSSNSNSKQNLVKREELWKVVIVKVNLNNGHYRLYDIYRKDLVGLEARLEIDNFQLVVDSTNPNVFVANLQNSGSAGVSIQMYLQNLAAQAAQGEASSGAGSSNVQLDQQTCDSCLSGMCTICRRRKILSSKTRPEYAECKYMDIMTLDNTLSKGRCLISGNGQYKLVMQGDGNLVLRDRLQNTPVWSTGTVYPEGTYWAGMQSDGNFVLYNGPFKGAKSYWSTNTHGFCRIRRVILRLDDAGNLKVYLSYYLKNGSYKVARVWSRFNFHASNFDNLKKESCN